MSPGRRATTSCGSSWPQARSNACSSSRTDVPCPVPRFHVETGSSVAAEPVQRRDVPGREVLDVDVVAHAGAVGGRVVVAEDPEAVEPADRDLGEVGHEVVRDVGRVLAERPRGVRTDRVEVAQQRHPPRRVGERDVAQHLLLHHLGPAVGVGRRGRQVLVHRHRGVGAVDRRGGGEDEPAHPVPAHGAHEREGRAEVVLVVLQRLGDRLADGLEPGEVDDGVERLVGEEVLGLVVVGEVEGAHVERLAGQRLDAPDDGRLGVREGVDDDDVVPGADELDDGV